MLHITCTCSSTSRHLANHSSPPPEAPRLHSHSASNQTSVFSKNYASNPSSSFPVSCQTRRGSRPSNTSTQMLSETARRLGASTNMGRRRRRGSCLKGALGVSQWDVWRMILRIFRHRNVEFLVAPYVSWAQVSVSVLPLRSMSH